MPQIYKGVDIPAYTDTADAPAAFRDMVDAGGAVSIVSSANRPSSPVVGHTIYNTSVGYHEFWNGSAWERVDAPIAAHPKMLGIDWVASGQSVPAITDSRQFYIQTGRYRGGVDAGSFFQITFPTAFPNGCLNVMMTARHRQVPPGFVVASTTDQRAFTKSEAWGMAFRLEGLPGSYEWDHCIGIEIHVDWLAIGY